MEDPDSVTKFWMGHPHRRWTTFCRHSSTTELLRSKAEIYIAQGTDDRASFIGELDVLRAELAAHGREFVVERIAGADHRFRVAGVDKSAAPHGFEELFGRILAWFFS